MGRKYQIDGKYPLSGIIKPSGNKNAALPVIAASLLTDEEVILRNIPEIEDVIVMIDIARDLGACIKKEKNCYRIKGSINKCIINPDLGKKIRTSILFAGPLLARCGEVQLPPPGGDVIGRRRLDTHFLAFEQLGATVTATHRLEFRASRLRGADVFLDEPSVTATENALVAAVAAR